MVSMFSRERFWLPVLRLRDIQYSIPKRSLLNGVSLDIVAGKRIALVGRNGSGKTTLMRLAARELQPDRGIVSLSLDDQVGYVPQGGIDSATGTVRDYLTTVGRPTTLWTLARLGDTATGNEEDAQPEVAPLVERGALYGALRALELDHIDPAQAIATLSGGQRSRLGLLKLWLDRPTVMLLDEPTNHLDLKVLLWLEQFLLYQEAAVLFISHDRAFIDRVATHVARLDDGKLSITSGGYQDMLVERRQKQDALEAAWRQKEATRRSVEEEIRKLKDRAQHTEHKTIDFEPRARAKKGARQAKVLERRLERRIADIGDAAKPQREWEVRLDFRHVLPGSEQALVVEHVDAGYANVPVLRDINLYVKAGDRIVITGPNGSGKSTLLNTLAGLLAPLAGQVQVGVSARIGYLQQVGEFEHDVRSPLDVVMATQTLDVTAARAYLHFFLFQGDAVFTPCADLSFGERSRLSLAVFLLSGANVLLLDEPLNHLDVQARERLERALSEFPGTSITVAHDRAFIGAVATRILAVRDGQVFEDQGASSYVDGAASARA